MDRTLPEAAGLNQHISSLIPVAWRAESTASGADTTQRVLSSLGGGIYCSAHGGPAGDEGAGLGLVSELISSPTGQIIVARSFNRSVPTYVLPAIRGGALQLERGNQ